MKKINTQGIQIYTFSINENDFISLTDIARYKNVDEPKDVVKNWMRNRHTIEYLGAWEKINNSNFKGVEFDSFRSEAGLNSFVLSPQKWIENTGAIGIVSRQGNGGGTFAHKDIAFEFASWLSPEFKLYLIKEFQRLKVEENERLNLGWDAKRMLTKINYKIHTDAIKEHIVLPQKLSIKDSNVLYANEADVLNKALFGFTAKEWRDANPKLDGNVRDYAEVSQLVCLANLESLNAEYIRIGVAQGERLLKLNESAISQMRSLLSNPTVKKLGNKSVNRNSCMTRRKIIRLFRSIYHTRSRLLYKANKEKARILVRERLVHYNDFYKFSVGKIAIRNQRSRWGSCSKKGNLNFNYKIVFLSPEMADYIIVHELCHICEFNHSKNFWALVAKTVPEYREIRNKLKKVGANLG